MQKIREKVVLQSGRNGLRLTRLTHQSILKLKILVCFVRHCPEALRRQLVGIFCFTIIHFSSPTFTGDPVFEV